MGTATAVKPPVWYWLLSVLALLWMLFGVLAWCMDLVTDETTAAHLSEGQRQLYAARPQWVFVAYGLSVFTGLAGTIGLLLRKPWATTAFAVSLVLIVVQFGYMYLFMDAIRILGAVEALAFPIVIFLVGLFLWWFSKHARRRGWIAGGA